MASLIIDCSVACCLQILVSRTSSGLQNLHLHIESPIWVDDEGTAEMTALAGGPGIRLQSNCTSNATYRITSRIPEIRRNKAKCNQALKCIEV